MAWNSVRIRFSRQNLGLQRSCPRNAMIVAVLSLCLDASLPSPCEGAGIARYLTAADRSQAVLISESGLPIATRSVSHPGDATSQGGVPAYVAFPLLGGEHLPGAVPTVTTGPQSGGTAVGPLDLNPLVQANLNSALDSSRIAVVQTPSQSYAVEYLPRYARMQAHLASSTTSSTSSSTTSGQATPSSSESLSSASSLSTLASKLTIEGIPASELSNWFKTGSNGLLSWTKNGLTELEKTLHLSSNTSSHKATALKPSLNLAAEMLVPPASADSSTNPLPAPIPEPSTWLVFGLMLGAAGLRQWGSNMRRRPGSAGDHRTTSRRRASQGQRRHGPTGGRRRDELVGPVRESALKVGLKRLAPRLDEP